MPDNTNPENPISQTLPQGNSQAITIEKMLQLLPMLVKMTNLKKKNKNNDFLKMLSETIK